MQILLYYHTTKWYAEFNNNRVISIHKQFATFYVVILTILHSSYYPVVAPSLVRFSHAKVQRSSGVKHHCANGSLNLPGSLPQIKDTFQFPDMPCLSGWVFREILYRLLAFPSFPAVWLACKISPARKAERLPKGGKRKASSTN